MNIIASMQPPHAVEDKLCAEERVGPDRIKGGYAWRVLRRAGARVVFNSDLAGSDHDNFYGLHAAITRRRGGIRIRICHRRRPFGATLSGLPMLLS